MGRRMLRDPDTGLNQVPGQQLRALLGHMRRPGQSLSDIVRRSSGIPFACTALLQADMCTARKVNAPLLPAAPPSVNQATAREHSSVRSEAPV